MKLGVNSLPFVKASRTVSREDGPPAMMSRTHNDDDVEKRQGGLRLDNNSISVTVRRDAVISDRKRKESFNNIDLLTVKPCSLEELPPPSKLRRKIQLSSKVEKPLSKRSRNDHNSAITDHIASLKRKRLASINVQSSPHQVVPPSPHIEETTDIFIEEPVYPKAPSFSLHSSDLPYHSLSPFDCNPPVLTLSPDPPVYEGSAIEKAVEPLFSGETEADTYSLNFLHESFTDFSPEIRTVQVGDRPPFALPLPSPPSSRGIPPPFNPVTFGIHKLFPREE